MKKNKKTLRTSLIEWIITILAVIIVFYVTTNVVQIGVVNGRSMESTYYDGELVMINKLAKNFDYNQVITFEYSEAEEDYYEQLMGNTGSFNTVVEGDFHIKRIVGLPGDEIRIEDSKLYVNDKLVSESTIYIPDQAYTVPEGEYFVQGDNIDNSFDSRLHGPIPAQEIYGAVITGDTTKE